jgi:hypothetical protein
MVAHDRIRLIGLVYKMRKPTLLRGFSHFNLLYLYETVKRFQMQGVSKKRNEPYLGYGEFRFAASNTAAEAFDDSD